MYRIDSALNPPVPRPREAGRLEVGEGHSIWWEEAGPADGVPLLVLHGGPGGRIVPYYRRLADPRVHRAIYFDQRGCGNSVPFGSIESNDTWRLVADIERLREARGVERWIVLGGSWGSTLALAYAETHPRSLAGLVLSGVFLARTEDSAWWWEGARRVFPDAYSLRDEFLTEQERADPRASFTRRILDPDPAIHGPAAQTLMLAEFSTLGLWPSLMLEDPYTIDPQVVAAGRIHAHYDKHRFFLEEDQLLRDAGALAEVPGEIIAGRADMCTPPKGAFDLARVWSRARLTIVPAAGHRWNDEMLCRDIVAAMQRVTAHARR
jgi:proline iminopeptidase